MKTRLFAVGDIHGCFEQLKELVENQLILNRTDKLVFLGDYIDRGTKSKEVVDFIINLKTNGYNITSLLGNHEQMLLDAYCDENNISLWMQNGGAETLNSFHIKSPKEIDEKYIDFLKNLPYYFSSAEFLFVHAGFNDNAIDPYEDKYSMIWNSTKYYSNSLLIDKTIIHGHRPITLNSCIQRVMTKQKVINIDTGCVYKDKEGYGKLTAM